MFYFGGVFQLSACVMPKSSKIDDWMSFPEIGPAHTPNFNKTKNVPLNFDWMSFPWIGLVYAPEIC